MKRYAQFGQSEQILQYNGSDLKSQRRYKVDVYLFTQIKMIISNIMCLVASS